MRGSFKNDLAWKVGVWKRYGCTGEEGLQVWRGLIVNIVPDQKPDHGSCGRLQDFCAARKEEGVDILTYVPLRRKMALMFMCC